MLDRLQTYTIYSAIETSTQQLMKTFCVYLQDSYSICELHLNRNNSFWRGEHSLSISPLSDAWLRIRSNINWKPSSTRFELYINLESEMVSHKSKTHSMWDTGAPEGVVLRYLSHSISSESDDDGGSTGESLLLVRICKCISDLCILLQHFVKKSMYSNAVTFNFWLNSDYIILFIFYNQRYLLT